MFVLILQISLNFVLFQGHLQNTSHFVMRLQYSEIRGDVSTGQRVL